MAETALSIIPERKSTLQTRAARDVLSDYVDYRASVLTDGSVDDKRKLVELQMRLIGAEADKKLDPNANLPTFNFVFHNGIHASIEPALQVQDITDVQPKEEPQLLQVQTQPPPTLEASGLDALLGDIDRKLGL